MAGAFGLAGFYFGRKPTTATSEADVSVAHSSMPWQVDHDHEDHSKHFKYQYHPKGDRSQTPKNAPSALNTVVVPNVTLPKVCGLFSSRDRMALTGHCRTFTTLSTNGAKRVIEEKHRNCHCRVVLSVCEVEDRTTTTSRTVHPCTYLQIAARRAFESLL
jgi:hypothetical protein